MKPTGRAKRALPLLLVAWLAGVGCLVPPPSTDPTSDAGSTAEAGPTSDATPAADGAPLDASGDTGLPSEPGDSATASDAADATTTSDAADPADASADPGDAATDPGDANVDAADASVSACSTSAVDPATDRDVWTFAPTPPGAFRCPAGSVFHPRVFQVTRDTHFTMLVSHTLNPTPTYRVSLHRGCDPSSPALFSLATQYTPVSRIIGPGIYTFVTCEGRGKFIAEPAPAPTNTNTSCATAAALPSTGVRMYDPAETRYYTFVATGTDNRHYIDVLPAAGTATGRARFVVRSSCADPATEVYDTQNGTLGPSNSSLWTNGVKRYELPVLQQGRTYWIVLDEVDPGLLFTLKYGRYP